MSKETLPVVVTGKVLPRRRYNSSLYGPERIEQLLAAMEQGKAAKAQLCVILGIDRQTFYNWLEKYPEFAQAYAYGKELAETWWTNVLQEAAAGNIPKCNMMGVIYACNNYFPETFKHPRSEQNVNVTFVNKAAEIQHLSNEQLAQRKLLLEQKIKQYDVVEAPVEERAPIDVSLVD